MSRWWSFGARAVIALVAACGRLGFEAGARDGDVDAALGAFGPPVAIDELNTNNDETSAVISSADGAIYFCSDRSGSHALWTAPGTASPFGVAVPLGATDLGGIEYDVELSSDGLELYFISDAPPRGLRRLTRARADLPWEGTPELVALGADTEGPVLARGDLRMLIATPAGIDEWERTDRASAWTYLRSHARLAGMSWPGTSPDGLEIYAVREATEQLFHATRASADAEFGPPTRLRFGAPLDDAGIVDPHLRDGGRTLYLSIRSGDQYDLYVTTR